MSILQASAKLLLEGVTVCGQRLSLSSSLSYHAVSGVSREGMQQVHGLGSRRGRPGELAGSPVLSCPSHSHTRFTAGNWGDGQLPVRVPARETLNWHRLRPRVSWDCANSRSMQGGWASQVGSGQAGGHSSLAMTD